MEHHRLLNTAAGISTVDLRCHEHTWEFIVRESAALAGDHFRAPSDDLVIRMDSTVTVPISGPTLVAILDTMFKVKLDREAEDDVRRALATRVYINISVLLETSGVSIAGQNDPVPTLTIDNRPYRRVPDEDDQEEPAYGYGKFGRPLPTARDRAAESIRAVLRSGGCREFTDAHGGFDVNGDGDAGDPFSVAAADDDGGDQAGDVLRYTELLRGAGYKVEPDAEDPLSILVWPVG